MRSSWACGLLLACVSAVTAQPASKIVRESWSAAYLNGEKAGYSHTTVVEIHRDGVTLLRTTEELNLKFKYGNSPVTTQDEHGDERTVHGLPHRRE